MALDSVNARTKRRRLPSVDVPQTEDDALRRSIESFKEHIRMYEGDSGAPKERFVTIKELELAGLIGTKIQNNFALIDSVLGDDVTQGQQAETTEAVVNIGANTLRDLTDTNVAGAQANSFLQLIGGEWVGTRIFNRENTWTALQTFNRCLRIAGIDSGYVTFCHDNTYLNITSLDTSGIVLESELGLNWRNDAGAAVELGVFVGGSAATGELPDLSPTVYDSVSGTTDLQPEQTSYEFSDDGLILTTGEITANRLHNWSLGTAFDVTTINTTKVSSSVVFGAGPDYYPMGLKWTHNGTVLWRTKFAPGELTKSTITTPYDITELTTTPDQVLDLVPTNDRIVGFDISPDGLHIIAVSNTTEIRQYDMSTPWDLTTATFVEDFTSTTGACTDVVWSGLGDRFWLLSGGTPATVYQYNLSVPWDISTALYDTGELQAANNTTEVNVGSIQVFADRGELYIGWYGNPGVDDCIIEKHTFTPIDPGGVPSTFIVGDPAYPTKIEGSTTNITSASTDIDGTLNVDDAVNFVSTLLVNGVATTHDITIRDPANTYSTTLSQVASGWLEFQPNVASRGFGTYFRETNILGVFAETGGASSPPVVTDSPSAAVVFFGEPNADFLGYVGFSLSTNMLIQNDIPGGGFAFAVTPTAGSATIAGRFYADDPFFSLENGWGLRITDALETDWAEFSHDGTDFNTDFTNTSTWKINGATEFNNDLTVANAPGTRKWHFNANNGGWLNVSCTTNLTTSAVYFEDPINDIGWYTDPTNMSSPPVATDVPNATLSFWSDTGAGAWSIGWLGYWSDSDLKLTNYIRGANLRLGATTDAGAETWAFLIQPDEELVSIIDGFDFRVLDALGTRWADFNHDGTDFNTGFTNTANWNVNDIAVFNLRDSLLRLTDVGNSTLANYSLVNDALGFSGTGVTQFNISGLGSMRLLGSTTLDIREGSSFTMRGATVGNNVAFSHDDTDFNTNFVNTTDWNLTGLTSVKANASLLLQERAAAEADAAGYGQLWIKDDAPSTLWYTGDTGIDKLISPTGTIDDVQYAAPTAAFGLTDASGVQSALPAAIDTFTLLANSTYEFEGTYIFATGTTSKTIALAFALTGAVVTNINYTTVAWNGTAGALSTTQRTKRTNTVASTVVTQANTSAAVVVTFRGIMRVTTGGTVVPQINFSAAPGGTNQMAVGSYIKFSRLGSDTEQTTGGWA